VSRFRKAALVTPAAQIYVAHRLAPEVRLPKLLTLRPARKRKSKGSPLFEALAENFVLGLQQPSYLVKLASIFLLSPFEAWGSCALPEAGLDPMNCENHYRDSL